MKTVIIELLPKHHSGVKMGYMVKSTCLPNCTRKVATLKEAEELADYWEQVALSQYN